MIFFNSLKAISFFLLLSSPVLSLSSPANLNFVAGRGYDHPIARYNTHPLYQTLQKRTSQDDTEVAPIDNRFTFYQVGIQIGTPPVLFDAYIDIGSSDLWVVSSNNTLCGNSDKSNSSVANGPGCEAGVFDYTDSSTFSFNNSDFFIRYADQTFARGIWGTDTVAIKQQNGQLTLTNCSIGVALQSNTSLGQGVVGLGLPTIEASNLGPNSTHYVYENIPQLLRIQHNINPVAYSLWLNSANSSAGGEIAFGAVDQAKFQGELGTIPMLITNPNFDHPITMTVVLNSMFMVDVNGQSSPVMTGPVGVLFDCGSTYTYLPDTVVKNIVAEFGGQAVPVQQSVTGYVVDCGFQNSSSAVGFNFSGVNITVPLSELVLHLNGVNSTNACVFGLMGTTDVESYTLGDSFLRSVYTVYNLDDFEISVAQAEFNVDSSNVKAIDTNGIPGAVKAPGYNNTSVNIFATAIEPQGDFTGTRK